MPATVASAAELIASVTASLGTPPLAMHIMDDATGKSVFMSANQVTDGTLQGVVSFTITSFSGMGSFKDVYTTGANLQLSASTVSESATIGTTVGALSVTGGSGTYTFTDTVDPDSKFAISGTNLVTAALLDYETKTSHSVTIQADNGAGSVVTATFTINVTNVFEQPALTTLTIPANVTAGTTINISGATATSMITGSLPAGWTLNSAARTIDIAAGAATGAQSGTLVENLPDSPNDGNPSAISTTVAPPAGTYHPDAVTYFAAMTVQPDATRKQLLSDFIQGLDTDGIWAKLDWCAILAAHDAQAARVNAKNPAKLLIAINVPTFTVDRGYSGDAVSSYLSMGEAPGAGGGNFALDSCVAGAWCNLQGASTGQKAHMGKMGTGAPACVFRAQDTAANETYVLNDATTSNARIGGTRTGHRAVGRPAASTKHSWYNGVRSSLFTVASTSISATSHSFLRHDTTYTDDRLAAIYVGGGLTDAQHASMHSRLSTLLTAIGGN